MSDQRRLKRQLRNVSKRLINDTYANHVEGFINIIAAGTGVGKTYNIANSLIPSDFKEGKNKFLFLTVFKDNVEQDYRDLDKALYLLGIKVVKGKDGLDEFLDSDDDRPMCLITTLAGAVNGGAKNQDDDYDIDPNIKELGTNGKLLTKYLKDKNYVVYWDEAHFGGSS